MIMNLSNLSDVDKLKMFKVYDEWPKIASYNYFNNHKRLTFQNIKHIVFVGMGGSGTIGDIFSSILSKSKIHVSVVKGYHLPLTADSDSLVVVTSISGNTAETRHVLKEASERKLKIIALSSGGEIEKYCKSNQIDYRKIEQCHSPRASFPSYVYSLLSILEPIIPIKKNEVIESIKKLEEMKNNICSENLNHDNIALEIAEWIEGIPIIYYPWGLNAAAIRFKNSLQENSKIHAIIEDVLEVCHNGIVAWEKPSNVIPILIEGPEDNYNTKIRWQIIKKYFNERKISFKEIFAEEGNIFSKLICLIYLLDYISIYKAVLSKTNPSTVESIEWIKKRI